MAGRLLDGLPANREPCDYSTGWRIYREEGMLYVWEDEDGTIMLTYYPDEEAIGWDGPSWKDSGTPREMAERVARWWGEEAAEEQAAKGSTR